ncbi:MAG: trypsin-like peptidase domain-containing protein [Sulfolobales archaeon]|nr:trypsin-like peptidase domain-containing protein [Sulfolobales archaeon]
MVNLVEISEAVSKLVENIRDSVITIVTETPHPAMFFGERPVTGFGSGFIFSPGFAITNAHVVRSAVRITVIYSDGSHEESEVVAVDPTKDLALIEVARGDKPMPLGDSDAIKVGDIVLAIGSPLGLPGPSVTLGVVSALGRTIAGEEIILEDLIQTDAAINPGNSGGPLVNSLGEAVGVTTAIVPYAQGIGFAIPINTVKRFLEMLRKYGKPIRAWIGVYVANVTRSTASVMNLSISEGVYVVKVVPGTPAHRARIREGDVIIRAGRREVKRVRDLREAIEDNIEKGYIDLEIVRGGKRVVLEVPIMIQEL